MNLITPADGEELIATGHAIKPGRTRTICHPTPALIPPQDLLVVR